MDTVPLPSQSKIRNALSTKKGWNIEMLQISKNLITQPCTDCVCRSLCSVTKRQTGLNEMLTFFDGTIFLNSANVNSLLSLARLSRNTFSKCLRFSGVSSVRFRGLLMCMMKFIISSMETAPSLLVSANLKMEAGTPLLLKIL